MSHDEAKIQEAIIYWWDYNYPKEKQRLFHINNNASGYITKRKGAQLKRQGVRAGVSDLILIWKDRVYFIELKTPKGRQTETQKSFQSICLNYGHNYVIIRSLDQFIDMIEHLKILKQ